MRNAIIKEVEELTNKEVELLLENESVQDEIMRYANDMELFYLRDMFDYIAPYLSDYNIEAYAYSYIKVADAVGFINGVEKLDDDYAIFNDDHVETLKNAIEVADLYYTSEIGSDEYIDAMNDVNAYVKVISKYIVNEFVEILEYYGTFDRVYHESDYVTYYLEDIFNRECLIDGNNVTLI